MGQHKYNPTAVAAKAGELEPRVKCPLSKRQCERIAVAAFARITGADVISEMCGGAYTSMNRRPSHE